MIGNIALRSLADYILQDDNEFDDYVTDICDSLEDSGLQTMSEYDPESWSCMSDVPMVFRRHYQRTRFGLHPLEAAIEVDEWLKQVDYSPGEIVREHHARRRYLLYTNGVGAWLYGNPSSTKWCEIQTLFYTQATGKTGEYAMGINMCEQDKVHGIYYGVDLTQQGGLFTLVIMPDTTPEQIANAKAKLCNDQDVVQISEIRIGSLVELGYGNET